MNLVLFLTIGTLIATIFGEFGKYPFGSVGNSFNILDFLVMLTGSVFLVWKIGITKKLEIPRLYIYLLSFFLIGFFSLIVNMNFSGGLYLLRFVLYSLFFWIGSCLAENGKEWILVINKVLVSVGLVSAVIGFGQLFFFPDLTFLSVLGYDPHIYRLSGAFLDPNFLGTYLSVAYGFGLIEFLSKRSKLNGLTIFVLALAILLTFSRSAWLMFGIINLFIGWFLPKKIVVLALLICIFSVVFIPKVQQRINGAFKIDISASERFSSWEKGLSVFKKNPVIGIGFNNIRSYSIENQLLKPFTTDGGNSGAGIDSSWLLILATTGLIGIGVFGSFYFGVLRLYLLAFLKTKEKMYLLMVGLLFALFINSQFINSLFYPPLMMILFLFTGLYYAGIKKN